MRKKVWLTVLGIFVLTILAGLISIPQGPDIQLGSYYKEIKVHLGLDLQGGTSLLYQADVSNIAEADRADALEGVRDVIERRVNSFGVSEPIIQTNKTGADWRVIVELPGVTDVNQAIEMIGETPLLEFKSEKAPEKFTDEELAQIVEYNFGVKAQAQDVLSQALTNPDAFADLAKEYSADTLSGEVGGNIGEFSKGELVPEFEEAVFSGEIGQIYPELVETDFGYHLIRIDSRDDEKETASASHILFQTKSTAADSLIPEYEATDLSGKQLERAGVIFDPNSGLPQVSLKFDSEGKDLFSELTTNNIGKTIAIYLDNSAISIPRVSSAITDGEAVITGDFTVDEVKDLARRLNAGALPVPINLISQQNIGPSLGQSALERSLFAGLIGLLLVAIFMIVYYRLPGVVSVIALIIYAVLVLAIFKLWPVVLTLAGIAGFILAVGMAVDANVLIFERMKEELRRGQQLPDAIEDGFKRAWPSIRDSNISSLITCLILAWFGTSLIQGFAITLGIGVLISMFSAITTSRTLLRLMNRTKSKWLFGVKDPASIEINKE